MNKLQQIVVKSKATEVHKVMNFIEQICDEHNIFSNYYANIITSITEAFDNAIEHGNKFDENKNITVSFIQKNDGLTFCVEDQGEGFNPTKVNDPTDISNNGESGRGIFLMGILSDKMLFTNNGTKVCFKFLISSINKEISDSRVEKLKAFLGQNVHSKITLN